MTNGLTPIRDRMLDRVEELLAASSVFHVIYRGMHAMRAEPQRPSAAFWFERETSAQDNIDDVLATVDLMVSIFGTDDQDLQADAHEKMAAVVTALWVDPCLGNLALSLEEAENEVYSGDIGDPNYTALMTFQVNYRHKIGSWFE